MLLSTDNQKQAGQDSLDPFHAAPNICRLLFEIAHSLNYKITVSARAVSESLHVASANLAQERQAQLRLRKQLGRRKRDSKFPGAIAWTKQVAAITHSLLRAHPIRAHIMATNDAGPTHPSDAIDCLEEDPSGNEKIIFLLAFHLLSMGVAYNKIWRLERLNKSCKSHCTSQACFFDRYFDTFYHTDTSSTSSTGPEFPTNFDYMINFLRWDGASHKAIAIILDHILYGACILAPDQELDGNAEAGAGGANIQTSPGSRKKGKRK